MRWLIPAIPLHSYVLSVTLIRKRAPLALIMFLAFFWQYSVWLAILEAISMIRGAQSYVLPASAALCVAIACYLFSLMNRGKLARSEKPS
jgi:hypothetical protein